VLEILGAVCLIPGGHRRVMEAMSNFTKVVGEKFRFETAVNCLSADIMWKSSGGWIGTANVSQEEKFDRVIDLQVSLCRP
jgi:hypothetical protein